MTNPEKEDLFYIELRRGNYHTCQTIIGEYEPRSNELGDYFAKARMQHQLDGELGLLEDWSSGTDFSSNPLKHDYEKLLSNER